MKANKRVLIVDDEKDVIRFLTMVLEDAGFDVDTASDSGEALEKIKKSVPDMISLDIVMPGGSGIKLHRELKKDPAWSKIPIMVVTGHARDDLGKADFNEMTMSGPGIYLEKPINAETYIKAVNKILGMEENAAGKKGPNVKDEVKSLMDSADPETLKEILKIMKSKKK